MTAIAKSGEVPAIVLGTGITALGVIRSLARAKVLTYAVSGNLGFVGKSRYCRQLLASGRALTSHEDLPGFLADLSLDRAVLIPCSDDYVIAAGRLDANLQDKFSISQPDSEMVEKLLDKWDLYEILSKHNIPHPQTNTIGDVDELAGFPDDMFEHSFLKPRDSSTFFKKFWVKAFRITSREEAITRYKEAASAGLEMLLQDYIPGPPTNHYFIDGFVDRNGKLCAAFARQRIRMYPPYFGNSSYMTSIAPEQVASAISSLRTLFAAVNYRGVYSAEFKLDPRDNEYRILEVNVRPWWYIWFAEICNVPIALMQYRDALGLDVAPAMEYPSDVNLVYHYYDLHNFLNLRREGKLGTWEWLRSWMNAKSAVFSWRDPMPSLSWTGSEIVRVVKKRVFGQTD
jgi:predicted ATP-grasp superfamily ATP-dependent carboligase